MKMLRSGNHNTPLTDEQRAFTEQHHDEVVYGFLRKKGLDADEFWNVVILKYLYAVRIYLERPELQKLSFKTVAYRQMRGALCDHWTYLNRPKRKAPVYSLDTYDFGDDERLAAGAVHEQFEATEAWQSIMPLLTEKEMDSLQLKARGYSYREIASRAGITYSGICSRFYRMRCKARACVA